MLIPDQSSNTLTFLTVKNVYCYESIAQSPVDTSFLSMASFPYGQQRPAQPIRSSSNIAYRYPSQSSSNHLMSPRQQLRPTTSCPGSVYHTPIQPRSIQSMLPQYQVRPATIFCKIKWATMIS